MTQLALFQRPPTCRFFLGTHEPSWLGRAGVPLFISRRRLARQRRWPRALAPWALDSGGFTEITQRGKWDLPPAEYAAEVRRYSDEIGMMEWAAVQDWMCEPFALARTGLDVPEHQRRTIRSYLELRDRAPAVPWVPVLQGWTLDDYRRHLDDYASAGVDLRTLPVVGVGSVCRRQNTTEAAAIFGMLYRYGLRLHGFGLKLGGLRRASHLLASADSLAWSYRARRSPPMPGHLHKSCANCMAFALEWRHRVIETEGVMP